MRIMLCILCAAALLGGCATTPRGLPPLKTVTTVEPDRFLGEWFVIANIPYFAERGHVQPRVIYRQRDDGRMDDLYYYREDFGQPEQLADGVAWIPDPSRPGDWKTRFIWPFTFDYRIVALDPDYRFTAVAHPSRKYAWIMARTPDMAEPDYQRYVDAVVEQGYQAEQIMRIAHRPEQRGREGFQE
jgi:apolipoprotein D and lipocalin family protein